MKAHQALDQFYWRSETEMTAWLRTILANTLTDALRKYGAAARDVNQEEVSLETAQELLHLHGYSVDAIAGQMGRSASAVDGLLWRGMKKLRDDLRVRG